MGWGGCDHLAEARGSRMTVKESHGLTLNVSAKGLSPGVAPRVGSDFQGVWVLSWVVLGVHDLC